MFWSAEDDRDFLFFLCFFNFLLRFSSSDDEEDDDEDVEEVSGEVARDEILEELKSSE